MNIMEDILKPYPTLFFLLLVSLLTVLIRTAAKTRPNHRQLPPSPPALPVVGHLHLIGPFPHLSFHSLSNLYGPLIHLRLGSSLSLVLASSSEIAEAFLKPLDAAFSSRPHFAIFPHLFYPSAYFIFAEGGPRWRLMRHLCGSRLLGGAALDRLLGARRRGLARFVGTLLSSAEAGRGLLVGPELMKLTNDVIAGMAIGRRLGGEEAAEMAEAVKEATQLVGRFNLSDLFWFLERFDVQGLRRKSERVHEKFDRILERIVGERREAREKGRREEDLLDHLLDILEDESSEIRLSRDNIKSCLMEIFMAATDSTSNTIEWALSELINHQNMMSKAREEIDSVVGKTRLVEESDIINLPYIQAIVKETLRLYPTSLFITRVSSEPCTVNGYHIPKNTPLFVNLWAIGRDPKHWENPLEFNPERFLGQEESGKSLLGQNFNLLPFGTGRRSCPGASLSLRVAQSTLATMIQCFEWKIGENESTVDMEVGSGVTLPRAHPLVCFPVARLTPMPI